MLRHYHSLLPFSEISIQETNPRADVDVSRHGFHQEQQLLRYPAGVVWHCLIFNVLGVTGLDTNTLAVVF